MLLRWTRRHLLLPRACRTELHNPVWTCPNCEEHNEQARSGSTWGQTTHIWRKYVHTRICQRATVSSPVGTKQQRAHREDGQVDFPDDSLVIFRCDMNDILAVYRVFGVVDVLRLGARWCVHRRLWLVRHGEELREGGMDVWTEQNEAGGTLYFPRQLPIAKSTSAPQRRGTPEKWAVKLAEVTWRKSCPR